MNDGKGKRPNKACSLTQVKIGCLWTCGQLRCSTPQSLINTLWWQFTRHFGMRGRQEHHYMKIEDFEIKINDNGKEYITYAEEITKTRQSGLHEKTGDSHSYMLMEMKGVLYYCLNYIYPNVPLN